jgi:hypothetical protein
MEEEQSKAAEALMAFLSSHYGHIDKKYDSRTWDALL